MRLATTGKNKRKGCPSPYAPLEFEMKHTNQFIRADPVNFSADAERRSCHVEKAAIKTNKTSSFYIRVTNYL